MEKILKHIDENYQKIITKEEIENLVCYSQRNSQRLFKRFFNESIRTFQKRLKLENAYKKLVFSNDSIKNIAYDVGYKTQSSLNKAFIKHFKITPTKAREKKLFLFENFIQQTELKSKNITFNKVYIPTKTVYYKMVLTNNYKNNSINTLWKSIEIDTHKTTNTNYYGLILDQPLISDITKCRYEACIDTPQKSNQYFKKNIFGKNYLKFIHHKEFDSIEKTYRQIFYKWMYHLNYQIDNSPIIEHYIKDTNNKDGYKTIIYIPII